MHVQDFVRWQFRTTAGSREATSSCCNFCRRCGLLDRAGSSTSYSNGLGEAGASALGAMICAQRSHGCFHSCEHWQCPQFCNQQRFPCGATRRHQLQLNPAAYQASSGHLVPFSSVQYRLVLIMPNWCGVRIIRSAWSGLRCFPHPSATPLVSHWRSISTPRTKEFPEPSFSMLSAQCQCHGSMLSIFAFSAQHQGATTSHL